MIQDEVREKCFRYKIFKKLEAVIDRLYLIAKDLAEDVQHTESIPHLKRQLIQK